MRAEERIKIREVLTIIENGRDLIEIKETLEHGRFTTWIKRAFRGAITERTARRWMDVALYYDSKSDILSLLNDSVMMLLAAPSMPDEVHEEVEARVLAGENFQPLEGLAHRMTYRCRSPRIWTGSLQRLQTLARRLSTRLPHDASG